MPKITVNGGASNANLEEPELVQRADALGTVEEVQPNPERAAELERERDSEDENHDGVEVEEEDDGDLVDEDEEVDESPGNSTSTSFVSLETSSGESEDSNQSHVPTTEPSSNPDPTDTPSVVSVGGHTVTPPSRGASRAEWLDFAREQGFNGDETQYRRDDLIRWWEEQPRL